MFQKVSVNQLFLFEVWGNKGYIAPAPGAYHHNKALWKAKGSFGGKEFELEIGEEYAGKDKVGIELPLSTANNTKFSITFTRGEEKDSMEGTTKFL